MPEDLLFAEVMRESAGFMSVKDRGLSFSDEKIQEAWDLVANSEYKGRRVSPRWRAAMLEEALTTSDFPYLLGDVLDRQLLANYKAVEPAWKPFTKKSTVSRIDEDARRFATYGGDNYLDRVGEKGEYLASPRRELRYLIQANKYGRQADISWEAMINDDLGALRDFPQRFATAAIRTEHRIMTTLYASDVGGHVEGAGGNLYAVGTNCCASGAGPLTIANLETGVETMNGFTDIGGEPILATPKFLVVCPAIETTARAILTSSTVAWSDNAGGPVAYPTANVIAQQGLILIVDKYLPIVNTGNDQHTQWYLFSDPSDIAALEAAHLQGHENPEIVMKASDKVSPTGAPVSPFAGDFATDNVFYRVRTVFGGAKMDWRATYMGGYVV